MNGLDLLDVLTIASFLLQIQNQSNIIGISDVQAEVNRAVGEIHKHLEAQDAKLNTIMEKVNEIEDHQKAVRDDRL